MLSSLSMHATHVVWRLCGCPQIGDMGQSYVAGALSSMRPDTACTSTPEWSAPEVLRQEVGLESSCCSEEDEGWSSLRQGTQLSPMPDSGLGVDSIEEQSRRRRTINLHHYDSG